MASLVDQAFPARTLGEVGDLERRLHQFRYVISSQQAQYIRNYYKQEEMTDGQALAIFLRAKKDLLYGGVPLIILCWIQLDYITN